MESKTTECKCKPVTSITNSSAYLMKDCPVHGVNKIKQTTQIADQNWKMVSRHGDKIEDIVCSECGSDFLRVGVAEYFTAIKCGKCGHEESIHEG